MEARDLLLYFSLKYHGDWNSIYNAVLTKEDVDYETVENTKNAFKGNFITYLDKEYPDKLRCGFKPPFVLFYEGNINLLNSNNIISVSCSREVAIEDYRNAELILKNDLDVIYIVGSAKNDMDQHITIFGKPTIAVIGHSLMAKQPIEDYSRYDLIITEVAPNELEITKENMMWRTRIIASLCDKELVISATKMSGTAVVVNQVLDLGKDVLVVPKLDQELLNFQLLEEGAIGCTKASQLI